MAIDSNDFKKNLENEFIKLLDSERGLQAKLAKSIGKTASFFSEIKRGKPVNALHLKAVGIVLGSEKLCDLLSIDTICQDRNKSENLIDIELRHMALVKKFQDKEAGIEVNQQLIELEQINKDAFYNTTNYIKGALQTAKVMNRKIEEPKQMEGGRGKRKKANQK